MWELKVEDKRENRREEKEKLTWLVLWTLNYEEEEEEKWVWDLAAWKRERGGALGFKGFCLVWGPRSIS